MARLYKYRVLVEHLPAIDGGLVDGGLVVGYGLFKRGKVVYVRFVDHDGKRVKKSLTGSGTPRQRAEQLIRDRYFWAAFWASLKNDQKTEQE